MILLQYVKKIQILNILQFVICASILTVNVKMYIPTKSCAEFICILYYGAVGVDLIG